jgi:hypothetical protein
MANYKKIADVTTVTETTENMNVLIEDNGLLKKISATKVGGGNNGGGNNVFIITTDSGHSDAQTNMDFATLEEAYYSGNPIIGVVITENGVTWNYDFINSIQWGDGEMTMTTSSGLTVRYNSWNNYPTFEGGSYGG